LTFRLKFFLFIVVLAGMFLPPQIAILPMFQVFSKLGLYDTHIAQIIVHIAWTIPVATLILRNFFRTIPFELQDAAKIDGCSHFVIWYRIILPLAKAAVVVLGILQFTWVWNSYLWGLILSEKTAVPVMVQMARLKSMYRTHWELEATGVIILVLPVIVVFLLFQKHFVKGLLMGSGK
jgi:ABC-type glycerol-3-phosphate transport system permease component